MTLKTAADAIAALTKVVEIRGADYVYDAQGGDCLYVDRNSDVIAPSCAVGVVIYNEYGIDALNEEVSEYTTASEQFYENMATYTDDPDNIPDKAAKRILDVFQNNQDSRIPYRECLELAIKAYEEEKI